MLFRGHVQRTVPFQAICLRQLWHFSKQFPKGLRNKRGTVGRGDCPDSFEGSTRVLPARRGSRQVSPAHQTCAIVPIDPNHANRSYLVELRNIAINFRWLSYATSARLDKAAILVASRRVWRQKSGKATYFPDDDDEEDWDLEYNLLAPNQVAIADDTIALQQFSEVIFCAPQEDILEGEYGRTSTWHSMSTVETTGFYQSLGCKRLSELIREEYLTTQEIYGHRAAQDVRSLILERLPLFLHGHTHATIRVSFTWLNDERNFIVRTFDKVTVKRSLDFVGARSSKSIETSAIAKREGEGPIQLWLAGNAQVDMYEVATSLCRLLFDTYKANDALLFMTMLSMDFRALRRRGYNGN